MHRKITPSIVISVLALFVALGGTGYAISKLPANSVGTKQVKRNAINSSKVKDRSLLAKDFKSDQLPAGKKGADGSALAYAYIEDVGFSVNAVPGRSKGITSAMVSRPQTGVYCFELSSLGSVKNATATAETQFNDIPESDKVASLQVLPNVDFGFGCAPDSDMVVLTRDLSTGSLVNWFFYVTLN